MKFNDNTILKNEGNRVIGLKDEDLKKLEKSYKSETVVNEVATPVMETPAVERPAEVEAAPVSPIIPEEPVTNEPIVEAESVDPVVDSAVQVNAEEAKNIFDQMVEDTPVVSNEPVKIPEVTIPGMEANVFDNPAAPVIEAPVEEPVVNAVENSEVTLNTPQDLYQTENEPVAQNASPAFEMPATVEAETPVVETTVDTEEVKPYEVYLDNIRKTIEDKDAMINALKEKNEVLAKENERLNNELKIANERMTIAEGARQQAFSKAAPQVNRVLTPENNNNIAA